MIWVTCAKSLWPTQVCGDSISVLRRRAESFKERGGSFEGRAASLQRDFHEERRSQGRGGHGVCLQRPDDQGRRPPHQDHCHDEEATRRTSRLFAGKEGPTSSVHFFLPLSASFTKMVIDGRWLFQVEEVLFFSNGLDRVWLAESTTDHLIWSASWTRNIYFTRLKMDHKICLVFTETVEREPSHLGVSGSWWGGRKLFRRVGHVRIFVGRVQIVPWGSGGPSQWDSTSGVRLRVPCRPNHEGRRWKVSQSSIKLLNTFMEVALNALAVNFWGYFRLFFSPHLW